MVQKSPQTTSKIEIILKYVSEKALDVRFIDMLYIDKSTYITGYYFCYIFTHNLIYKNVIYIDNTLFFLSVFNINWQSSKYNLGYAAWTNRFFFTFITEILLERLPSESNILEIFAGKKVTKTSRNHFFFTTLAKKLHRFLWTGKQLSALVIWPRKQIQSETPLPTITCFLSIIGLWVSLRLLFLNGMIPVCVWRPGRVPGAADGFRTKALRLQSDWRRGARSIQTRAVHL